MFNKEFFPTPLSVIERMGIDSFDKICLEPSAGKGDIVDYLKSQGARKVIACEINEDLRKILSSKCSLVANDFFELKAEDVSHVELIVMNPPFSNADKHINHAWDIAPEGCEIIALCNWETLSNSYSRYREGLKRLANDYGEYENLGDCFSNAERKTGVEVGLIRLFKPVVSESFNYDGFYFNEDEGKGGEGIMTYNEIRAIVNSYVAAVRCYDRVEEVANELKGYTSSVGYGGEFKCMINYNSELTGKEAFVNSLQRHCWKVVFNKLKVDKYVTKGVMSDINSFIENRSKYPFTMKNIYRMIEIIVGTRGSIMKRAIVEAVDKFTKYTHENRYGLEGWKTNEGHLLNKKFISNYICEPGWSGDSTLRLNNYNSNFSDILDLVKALCYITGKSYDSIPDVDSLANSNRYFERNKWYDWGFFEFKLFKKGSGHFKFKNEKTWELLNREYAKIKGQVLPEKL